MQQGCCIWNVGILEAAAQDGWVGVSLDHFQGLHPPDYPEWPTFLLPPPQHHPSTQEAPHPGQHLHGAAAQHLGPLTIDQPGPVVVSMQSTLILRPVCALILSLYPFSKDPSFWKISMKAYLGWLFSALAHPLWRTWSVGRYQILGNWQRH